MKKIEVFFPTAVNTDKLEQKLLPVGIESLSLIKMRVVNSGLEKTEIYRGVERTRSQGTKIKAEILVADDKLADVASILNSYAEDGMKEPPKAFISDLSDLVQPAPLR